MPTPLAPEVIRIDAVLRPARNATRIESYLVENFFETILSGALAIILRRPGQAYTDLERAGGYAQSAMVGIQDAKSYAAQGKSDKVAKVKFSW